MRFKKRKFEIDLIEHGVKTGTYYTEAWFKFILKRYYKRILKHGIYDKYGHVLPEDIEIVIREVEKFEME